MHQGMAEQRGTDINQIATEDLRKKEFPAISPFRIAFSESAHETIWHHARGTLSEGELIKEIGGILVGDIFIDDNGPYIEIIGAIIAEHTRNEGTEVAFTPETWVQVNRVKDNCYAEQRIVGWYHTHPNFGIFLSDRDQFLHSHSFSQPWAVAFVVDPVQNLEGLFVWKDGELREISEYYIGQDRRSGKTMHQNKTAPQTVHFAEPASSWAAWFIPSAVSLLVVLTVLIMSYMRDLARADREGMIIQAIESEKVELDRAFQILRALRKELERVSKQSASDIAELKGQTEQLEGGLKKVNAIAHSLQAHIQGLEQVDREKQ